MKWDNGTVVQISSRHVAIFPTILRYKTVTRNGMLSLDGLPPRVTG